MIEAPDPVSDAARSRPNTIAVIDHVTGITLDYAALDSRVDQIARGLHVEGVRPHDRVAVCANHSAETVATIHAIRRLGATVAPIDPQLAHDRLTARIERIDPAMIVSDDADRRDGGVSFDSVRAKGTGVPFGEFQGLQLEQDACILFTSRTSGQARAVRLTTQNLRMNALASSVRLGVLPDDRWWVPIPPYHMGGFAPVIRACITGTGLIVSPFDVESSEQAIRGDTATVASMVPTMLRRGVEEGMPLSSLRVLLVGGDRTPPELVRRSLHANIPLFVTYGMTETASQIATAPPSLLKRDPETVGRPLRGIEVSIEQHEDAEPGEIVVSGPTVSPGYLDESNRFPDPGTIRTGDMGTIADGLLYVDGRIDERIVSGGVTVDPQVIEDALMAHPDVRDAAVIGRPDDTWGERACAFIETTASDVAGLESCLREELRPAERPREIIQLDALPRTASGTIDRHTLVERTVNPSVERPEE